MLRHILAAVAGLVLASSAFAQAGLVKGMVTDAAGAPVDGATLDFVGPDGVTKKTNSDKKGEFVMIGLKSGAWKVTAKKDKLEQTLMANVRQGGSSNLAFKIAPAAGGVDNKKSEPRKYSSDLYYGAVTAFDAANHKVLSKVSTDIEIRSGITATAGGLVFSALQDGWVLAYNDETLEELWRFNLGTPLKGSPMTYSIGPKQYLAVQTSGRHLHPVKFDNLENSSYLFVFALN